MTTSWTLYPNSETTIVAIGPGVPTLVDMSSTMLTKRRAVDHCLVRSSLCRLR